jgi:hypothetical protein
MLSGASATAARSLFPQCPGNLGDALGHRPRSRKGLRLYLEIIGMRREELEAAGDAHGQANDDPVGFDDETIRHIRLLKLPTPAATM